MKKTSVPLEDLVGGLSTRGELSPIIERLAWRDDQSRRDALFFCIPSAGSTELEAATRAIDAGATALVVSEWLPVSVPQIRVAYVVRSLGAIAAEFYGRPADKLLIAAVTGTNGKTTTTYLLESIFSAAGLTAGVLGSTGVRFGDEYLHTPVHTGTTPEAPVIQQWLAELRNEGALAVALEATSHALHQHRLDALRFACAIFTNLTPDHLDYHKTMENYFQAKSRLFTPELTQRAVLNADDPAAERLKRPDVPSVTFAIENVADVRSTDIRLTQKGISFRAGDLEITAPLLGLLNVSNCLGAIAASRSLGIEDQHIAEGLASVRQVPGRLEPVNEGQEFRVLVDYAHTPDGLTKVLQAVRNVTPGKILLVVSCGGDRDPSRRPVIGGIATELADHAFITAGSSRSEDPMAIIEAMLAGATDGRFDVEIDRRTAIAEALSRAGPYDSVLIVGRGPTPRQDFGDRVIPFDDRVVAAEELRRLGQRSGGGG
ncbi:MAG: UDP-N-acetylmuramoyl-L-alanyl-D-glutamate--2,6-diaminopimelate ligase [Actinomycetota bacterium]